MDKYMYMCHNRACWWCASNKLSSSHFIERSHIIVLDYRPSFDATLSLSFLSCDTWVAFSIYFSDSSIHNLLRALFHSHVYLITSARVAARLGHASVQIQRVLSDRRRNRTLDISRSFMKKCLHGALSFLALTWECILFHVCFTSRLCDTFTAHHLREIEKDGSFEHSRMIVGT